MLKDLLFKNRSYRKFDASYKINKEILIEIINNLRYIPTARNQQVLMYKSITDKETCDRVFEHLKWAGYLKDWDGPAIEERPSAYIIIAVNKNRLVFDDKWVFTDIGIAIQSILLQAVEKGLGGCTIAAFNKKKISEIIQAPENLDIEIVIALGKPAQQVEIVDVKDEKEIKYFEKNSIHFVPKRQTKEILF